MTHSEGEFKYHDPNRQVKVPDFEFETVGKGAVDPAVYRQLYFGESGATHAPDLDPRFPNTNMTRRCWQNYVDYFKCIARLGENEKACDRFFHDYHALCPLIWIQNWDQQRAENRFPVKFE